MYAKVTSRSFRYEPSCTYTPVWRREIDLALPPGGLEVLAVLPGVVQELGQVDDVAALLPVEQEAEAQRLVVNIVGERHLELGVRVADHAFPAGDLGGRLALLDLECAQ